MTLPDLPTADPTRLAGLFQRMRAAGLRETITRIGVLQVLAASDHSLSVEDLFSRLMSRGDSVSIATVYRAVHEFVTRELVLREWDRDGKARYRVGPGDEAAGVLQLVCSRTGRSVPIDDPALHARLVAAIRARGFDIADQTPLSIRGDLTDPRPGRRRPRSLL